MEAALSRYNKTEVHTNLEIVEASTRPAETHAMWGCSTEWGKWTWGPT